MVLYIRWSKTNQYGEQNRVKILLGNNDNPICPVRWIYHMVQCIPAQPMHNLFCYRDKRGILPITYCDLMVKMRHWIGLVGENAKLYSSHSLRRGATTHAYNANIADVDIQRLGDWRSQCYRTYIDSNSTSAQVKVWFQFNNKQ